MLQTKKIIKILLVNNGCIQHSLVFFPMIIDFLLVVFGFPLACKQRKVVSKTVLEFSNRQADNIVNNCFHVL